MTHMVTGLFPDSKLAGEAISELKKKGYTKDISLVSRDSNLENADSKLIKQDLTEQVSTAASAGAVVGALTGITAGLLASLAPGGILTAGPLALVWGITGSVIGGISGALFGALVDLGLPEERAKLYEDSVREGEVVVTTTVDHSKEKDVVNILNTHGVSEIEVVHQNT